MDNPIDRLFREFDKGMLSRRELLRALGVAAIAIPASSFAQGGGHDRRSRARARQSRAGRARRHDALAAAVRSDRMEDRWLDHITYQCTDYPKAAAFYSALMGWKVRSDDGKQAVLDIGDDVGGVIMTNGFVPPPRLRRHPRRPATPRRRPRRRTRRRSRRSTAHGAISNFAWGIEPWDTNKVEAELKKRGLNPVADHAGRLQELPH